tara:strand:- start:661 stop:1650 length:990 start_codon:yes stop_codon:yes gene_type:complete
MTNINNLIHNIKKLYNKYDNVYHDIMINYSYDLCTNYINNYIKEVNDTRWSNFSEISKYLNKCKYVCIFSSDYYKFKFYIYSSNKLNYAIIIKIIKLFKRICILNDFYNLNNNLFDFHICLCPHSRKIPYKNELFDAKHINGGFTIVNSNSIYIFRKDEFMKVALHEFIHHIPIINDSLFNLDQNNINILKNKFNISQNTILLPAESVVEFWATIYNLIFISIEYNISFKLLVEKEIKFSLLQYSKIRKINKYKIWEENTNTFCYIVLKLILLYNYKKFLLINIPYQHNDFVNFLIDNYNYKKYNIINKNNIIKIKPNNSLDIMLFSNF